jgi:hypothetical protein
LVSSLWSTSIADPIIEQEKEKKRKKLDRRSDADGHPCSAGIAF